MSKNLIGWLLAAAFTLFALFVIFSNASAATQQNPPLPTEPANCQYPGRNTNTPEHCDNSDPACPETIKFGYDCEPAPTTPVVEEKPTSQNVVTPEKSCGK